MVPQQPPQSGHGQSQNDSEASISASRLRELARRAAARARATSAVTSLSERGLTNATGGRSSGGSPYGSSTDGGDGANGGQRAHVSVSPRIAFDPPLTRGSEPRRAGGAKNAEELSLSERGVAPSKPRQDRDLVSEALVRAAAPGSDLVIPPGSRLTPAARDLAFEKGVKFVTGRYAEPSGPVRHGSTFRSARIAVASDHGGFALKDELIPLLKEMGMRPMDLGPVGPSPSVDYPDFAALVAAEVAAGRVDLGIIVDGAGIGSAMVANKFPGVKAANCWNEASARNAREHNHANVLTLVSGHLDLAGARLVVAAFLQTAEGGDRHARRAAKLDAIERSHLAAVTLAKTFDEGR